MSARTMTIRPIICLEGDVKVKMNLNETGNVENAYFQVSEFRGFERLCERRKAEYVSILTPRLTQMSLWVNICSHD